MTPPAPAHAGAPRLANVTLIGLRGAGKTSAGRALAQLIDWKFFDTDELVQLSAGRSITQIFAESGELAFRRLESTAVHAALNGRSRVVSVGGGAVLAETNRALIQAHSLCIWLVAPLDTLAARIASDACSAAQRPPLSAQNPLEDLRRAEQQRAAWYAALADARLETAGLTPAAVAIRLAAVLRERGLITLPP